MASFRCYDSCDVIAILIMTNFPLYLTQLWQQFFTNVCLWQRSLCSNLAGTDSEKLYRATFLCQYGLFCCMTLVSFWLFCKNLGNLQDFFGQMDYPPLPPWEKIARTPMDLASLLVMPFYHFSLSIAGNYFIWVVCITMMAGQIISPLEVIFETSDHLHHASSSLKLVLYEIVEPLELSVHFLWLPNTLPIKTKQN